MVLNERVSTSIVALVLSDQILEENGIFSSDILHVSLYQYLVGICTADVSGNLVFEFSHDGANFAGEITREITPNEKIAFNIRRCARYLRIKYENGVTAQTNFLLVVYGE